MGATSTFVTSKSLVVAISVWVRPWVYIVAQYVFSETSQKWCSSTWFSRDNISPRFLNRPSRFHQICLFEGLHLLCIKSHAWQRLLASERMSLYFVTFFTWGWRNLGFLPSANLWSVRMVWTGHSWRQRELFLILNLVEDQWVFSRCDYVSTHFFKVLHLYK